MAADTQPKIFKKYEIVEGGGHHGGGWKVAYADFMTAMMAFFLLMWILASSDEQKLRGIAEYFTDATMPGGIGLLDGSTLGPPGTLTASNGSVVARGSELGKMDDPSPAKWEVRDTTSASDPDDRVKGTHEGIQDMPAASDLSKADQRAGASQGNPGAADANNENKLAGAGEGTNDAEHAADQMKFEQLQNEILQAMQDNPDLDPLQQNVIFEETEEGLHIQIIDQEGKPMFQSGRAEMAGATDVLLSNLGTSLAALPNPIVLAGHTDAVQFSDSSKYDNWDLSSDRANATRRVFEASGVSRDRIIRVSGMADTQLLKPEAPTDPSNRRISIMVRYQDPTKASAPATQEAKQATDPAPMQHDAPKEVKHAKLSQPAAAPIGDKVFQDLRNALR
ncbi:OmpA family protein [Sulfitobacter sp. M57]|uniref:flagellar motor protein MotB n=1 Tax=unclassified Sulfitobacter TaxID=196795 RepID=UPI0023E2F1AE|nr:MULTISPECIES: flagellar motor protein MotB [unclassified Sulfitobacter]MDF3414844.1 OmpA family protein [Sulfitobacter sp. KE5]MDF3422325.1 OmpA family protein [Sulfitobacter sp. KE43]MDF3433390.1 OmpA family protein [Sulfitobacter sp. KE42]MDF3459030.1 OmpA family protein [Sulfitobacter sp. S74]MDF3462929.1 OmpA family protein [Sulfitobacter sp. Ks18]